MAETYKVSYSIDIPVNTAIENLGLVSKKAEEVAGKLKGINETLIAPKTGGTDVLTGIQRGINRIGGALKALEVYSSSPLAKMLTGNTKDMPTVSVAQKNADALTALSGGIAALGKAYREFNINGQVITPHQLKGIGETIKLVRGMSKMNMTKETSQTMAHVSTFMSNFASALRQFPKVNVSQLEGYGAATETIRQISKSLRGFTVSGDTVKNFTRMTTILDRITRHPMFGGGDANNNKVKQITGMMNGMSRVFSGLASLQRGLVAGSMDKTVFGRVQTLFDMLSKLSGIGGGFSAQIDTSDLRAEIESIMRLYDQLIAKMRQAGVAGKGGGGPGGKGAANQVPAGYRQAAGFGRENERLANGTATKSQSFHPVSPGFTTGGTGYGPVDSMGRVSKQHYMDYQRGVHEINRMSAGGPMQIKPRGEWAKYLAKMPYATGLAAEDLFIQWAQGAQAYPEWAKYQSGLTGQYAKWWAKHQAAIAASHPQAVAPTPVMNSALNRAALNMQMANAMGGFNVAGVRGMGNTPIAMPGSVASPFRGAYGAPGGSASPLNMPSMFMSGAMNPYSVEAFLNAYNANALKIQGSPSGRLRKYNASRARAMARLRSNIGYKVLGPSMLDSGGLGIMSMLKGMGVMYGIMGLGQLIGNAFSDYVAYDNTMQTAKNILGSHDNGMGFAQRFGDMAATVRSVGVQTKFTAPQVADAAKFLAMAGYNVETINKSIRPIADIALVGDTELGTTADLMTNIMTGYGIGAEQVRSAADIMTNTFTMSNTTLTEIAESYKYAAGLLAANGVSFQESAGAIGVLGNAGIKGSQAGTTMRTIIANLLNPTKKQAAAWNELGLKDANGQSLIKLDAKGNVVTNNILKDSEGNTRNLSDIFEMLNANRDNVNIYRLFHKTAAQGAVALMNNVDTWNRIVEQNFLSDGMVDKLAQAKKNTISGLWAQLTSMFTEDAIQSFGGINGKITEFLKSGVNVLDPNNKDGIAGDIKNGLNQVLGLLDSVKDVSAMIVGIWKNFGGLITGYMKLQMFAFPILFGARAIKATANALSGAVTGIGAIGNFVGGIGGAGSALFGKRNIFNGRGIFAGNRRYGVGDLLFNNIKFDKRYSGTNFGAMPGTYKASQLADPQNAAFWAASPQRQASYNAMIQKYGLDNDVLRNGRAQHYGDLRKYIVRRDALAPYVGGTSTLGGMALGGYLGSKAATNVFGAEDGGVGQVVGTVLGLGVGGLAGAKLGGFLTAITAAATGAAAAVFGVVAALGAAIAIYRSVSANGDFAKTISSYKDSLDMEMFGTEKNSYLDYLINKNNEYKESLTTTIALIEKQRRLNEMGAERSSSGLQEIDSKLYADLESAGYGTLFSSAYGQDSDWMGLIKNVHDPLWGSTRGTVINPFTGEVEDNIKISNNRTVLRDRNLIAAGYDINAPAFKSDNEELMKKWLGTTNTSERTSAGQGILNTLQSQLASDAQYAASLGINNIWDMSLDEINKLGARNPLMRLGQIRLWQSIIQDKNNAYNKQASLWDAYLSARQKGGSGDEQMRAYIASFGSHYKNNQFIGGPATAFGALDDQSKLPQLYQSYGIQNGLPTSAEGLEGIKAATNYALGVITQFVPSHFRPSSNAAIKNTWMGKLAGSQFVPTGENERAKYLHYGNKKYKYVYTLNKDGYPVWQYAGSDSLGVLLPEYSTVGFTEMLETYKAQAAEGDRTGEDNIPQLGSGSTVDWGNFWNVGGIPAPVVPSTNPEDFNTETSVGSTYHFGDGGSLSQINIPVNVNVSGQVIDKESLIRETLAKVEIAMSEQIDNALNENAFRMAPASYNIG